jgi:aminocarboxymuconate-semialdehyde decarboxylase
MPMSATPRGIDAHGHGVPAAFLEDVKRTGLGGVGVEVVDGNYVVTLPGQAPLRPMIPGMIDFEQRLVWLDAENLDHQLVGPWLDVHGQELPPEPGQEWVRRLNDALAEAIAPGGSRLRAYATLHLENPTAAGRELERATRELGMIGCMLPTSTPTATLHAPAFDALWEVLVDLDVPVMLHPPTVGPASCIPGMQRFGGLYGRLIDTTMAAAQLLLAGVFDRFPRLRIVLVHGGGFLPYQTGRLANTTRGGGFGPPLQAAPVEYVKRYFYDTTLMSSQAVALMADVVGADHVMLGSDYPFSVGAPPLLQAVNTSGLDAAAVEAIAHGTAADVFNMERAVR